MSGMLPERWKESLELVSGSIGRFLERLKPHRDPEKEHSPEHVTADVVPAFMQTGGPLLDMYESGTELVVSVEVPGLDKNEISVGLVGKRLVIRGEKQVTRQRKAGGGSVSESSFGSFTRSLQLPYDVDDRSIKADLKQGVLTIRMPRPESDRDRRHRVPVS